MNIDILKELQKQAPDLKIRTINNINIIFFETLCNSSDINDFILKPIFMNNIKSYNELIKIPFGNYKTIDNEKDLLLCLYSGFTIININNKFIACETKYPLNSSISEASNEKVVKGPKDAFTENYQNNIGLIRKRIRSKDLKINEYIVGSKSKTKVALLYLDNICDKELVNDMDNKIKNIDIDYLISINNNISKKSYTFPTYIMTERPDLVSFMLMEGRIIVLTEHTQEVLIIPTFFIDNFKSIDDYYQNKINVTITRIIRLIAFFSSIIIPGLYIALTTFNQETLPTSVLINFSMQREGVPFPSFIEAIILWITFELLREADTRVPFVVGSSMSIVGALVLGQAAVEAGLISPIMIIVIAISSVSSFLFNDNDIVNSIRIWKLIFLVLGSFVGLYGIFIGIVLFLTRISSINSFNYDYIKEKL